jgi:hypothetical protein
MCYRSFLCYMHCKNTLWLHSVDVPWPDHPRGCGTQLLPPPMLRILYSCCWSTDGAVMMMLENLIAFVDEVK